MIVFVATLGSLFSIPGQTMGFSVFTDVLMTELGLSRAQLSTAYCVGTVASGLTLPWLGRLLDRWGERKMGAASAVVTGVVLFYLSCVVLFVNAVARGLPDAWRPVVAFAAISLGFYLIRASAQGVLSMVCRNAIGKWFNFQRGFALAVSGILVSFGFSVAPRALDELVSRFGYDGAWRWMGILTIAVMGPLAWLLFRDTPEESGLEMDGGDRPVQRRENLDMKIHREFTRDESLATYSFWIFNLSFAFYAFYGTAFTFHIISLGEEIGFSRERILTLFFPMAAVSVTTNLLFGWINPYLRLKYLLVLMNGGGVLGAVGLLSLASPWGVPAYVIGNGIASGGFVSLSGIIWPRFFGRLHLGAISGVNMSTMVIASGLGPMCFGWCLQIAESYRPVLLMSVFVPGIFGLLSLWADNPQRAS